MKKPLVKNNIQNMLTWVSKDLPKSADYGTFVSCSIFKAWSIELRPKVGLFLNSNEISLKNLVYSDCWNLISWLSH